ncbi:HK97-gp10 family putative phage morphogenesis protein [Geobacillus vulcani]|uniref:HK97-gp10 family putative phage morphogenesis protein n=1 Tax=Geobacillus vulcani TaxID=135517 RepID=UPI0004DFAC0F|nr:HK97-gp10 family putative phage morphogenesis protein [Geobacillus vulcani]
MGFKLEGMQELLKKLETLGNEAEQVKQEALMAGAKVVQEAASQKAPRDTGKLAENIVISDVKEDGTVDIGPDRDRFYGLFLEFGTTKMAARPFLQPAFEENKEQVQQKMSDVIRRGLGL